MKDMQMDAEHGSSPPDARKKLCELPDGELMQLLFKGIRRFEEEQESKVSVGHNGGPALDEGTSEKARLEASRMLRQYGMFTPALAAEVDAIARRAPERRAGAEDIEQEVWACAAERMERLSEEDLIDVCEGKHSKVTAGLAQEARRKYMQHAPSKAFSAKNSKTGKAEHEKLVTVQYQRVEGGVRELGSHGAKTSQLELRSITNQNEADYLSPEDQLVERTEAERRKLEAFVALHQIIEDNVKAVEERVCLEMLMVLREEIDEQVSHVELAEELGVSPDTVRKARKKVLGKIHKKGLRW